MATPSSIIEDLSDEELGALSEAEYCALELDYAKRQVELWEQKLENLNKE